MNHTPWSMNLKPQTLLHKPYTISHKPIQYKPANADRCCGGEFRLRAAVVEMKEEVESVNRDRKQSQVTSHQPYPFTAPRDTVSKYSKLYLVAGQGIWKRVGSENKFFFLLLFLAVFKISFWPLVDVETCTIWTGLVLTLVESLYIPVGQAILVMILSRKKYILKIIVLISRTLIHFSSSKWHLFLLLSSDSDIQNCFSKFYLLVGKQSALKSLRPQPCPLFALILIKNLSLSPLFNVYHEIHRFIKIIKSKIRKFSKPWNHKFTKS